VHEKTYVYKSHISSSMDRSKSISMRSLTAFDKNDREDDAFSFRPRSNSTGNNDNPPENITKSLVSKFQDFDDKAHNASTSHINTDEIFMPAADATRKLVARFQRGGEIRRSSSSSSSSSSDEVGVHAEVARIADNKVPVIKKEKKETLGKKEKSDTVSKEENGPRSNSNDDKDKPPEDITRSLVFKYQSFNDKTHIAATTNINSDNNIMPAVNTTRNMVARFQREEGEVKRKSSSSDDDDVLAEVTRPAPAKLPSSLTSPFETDNKQKTNACEKTTASVSNEQKELVSKEEKMDAVNKDEKKDPVNLLDERIDEVQNLIALIPTSNITAAPVAHQDLFFSDGLHEMTMQKKTGRRLGSRSNSSSSSDNECGVNGHTTTDFNQHNTNSNFHLQIIT
jgi:hypothetical protein